MLKPITRLLIGLVFCLMIACQQEKRLHNKDEVSCTSSFKKTESKVGEIVNNSNSEDSKLTFQGDSALFKDFLKTLPVLSLPLQLDSSALVKLARDSAFYITEGAWHKEEIRIEPRFEPFLNGKVTHIPHLFTRENAGSVFYHYVGILKKTSLFTVLIFSQSDGSLHSQTFGATLVVYDVLGKIIGKKDIAWTSRRLFEQDNFANILVNPDLTAVQEIYEYNYDESDTLVIVSGAGRIHAGKIIGLTLRKTNNFKVDDKGNIVENN